MGTNIIRKAGGRSAPAFRASATTTVSVGAATWNITRPTGTNTSLLCFIAAVGFSTAPPTATGWEQVGFCNNGDNMFVVFARPANGNSDPATFAFTFPGGPATGGAVMVDYTPSVASTSYFGMAFADVTPQQAPSVFAPTSTIIEAACMVFSTATTGITISTNVNTPTTRVPYVAFGNQALFIVDYPFTGPGATTGDTFNGTGTFPQIGVFSIAMV